MNSLSTVLSSKGNFYTDTANEAQRFIAPKKKLTFGKIMMYGFLGIIGICVLSVMFGNEDPVLAEQTINEPANKSISADDSENNVEVDPAEEAILVKLKAKAKKNWPDDYSTQEYWITQELEDYKYMKTISASSLKSKAERNWPLDFSTQKYWYDEQIEAQQRLK